MASALFTRWLGDEVTLLEKAVELGGTTRKSGWQTWIPNNRYLRDAGINDREEDFLRLAARTARPEKYDPQSPTFGQSEWEFEGYRAFYRSAWPAMELLHERGALRHTPPMKSIDYWGELPEDTVPTGRTLGVEGALDDGGMVGMASMERVAREDGVVIHTGHRVQRLIVDDQYAVIGVVATTADGKDRAVGARKGVIFASGGFAHDRELRENFLATPILHAGAVLTNEGDFIRIATRIGAQLHNMQQAWHAMVNLEYALRRSPHFFNTFIVAGDSMICVNRSGVRVFNEKIPKSETVPTLSQWDPMSASYPNWPIIQLWDQHSQDHSATAHNGNSIVPPGGDDRHVITGATIDELTVAIRDRLAGLRAHSGNAELADDFLRNLQATIRRWNDMAERGFDDDFQRGNRALDILFNGGPVADEPGKKNPVMWPISDSGPYYATLLMPGALDTKGGPKTDSWARVVDDRDVPIPGLYAVGNCAASPTQQVYWGSGGTLGPIVAFAYRAAGAIHRDPARELVAGERRLERA